MDLQIQYNSNKNFTSYFVDTDKMKVYMEFTQKGEDSESPAQ